MLLFLASNVRKKVRADMALLAERYAIMPGKIPLFSSSIFRKKTFGGMKSGIAIWGIRIYMVTLWLCILLYPIKSMTFDHFQERNRENEMETEGESENGH